MPLNILRPAAADSTRLNLADSRYAPLICMALLATACALASFVFACATPFAAFAVIAAAALPFRFALFAVGVAWLVNQAIGFGFLNYPWDENTILWGIVIGMAALIATAVSTLVLRAQSRTPSLVAFGSALIAAYAAYELVLFAATPALGGAGDFAVAIVGRLAILNVLWFVGLFVTCEVVRLLGTRLRSQVIS